MGFGLRAAAVGLALLGPGAGLFVSSLLGIGCGARTGIGEGEEETVPGSDAALDRAPDVLSDVPADIVLDVSADIVLDVVADVMADVSADVVADVMEDVSADVVADVQLDSLCPDNDGDGYGVCEGDCDDSNPLLNPGAFDFPDGVDEDCSGGIDDAQVACGGGLQYSSQNANDYAKAIDICQTTVLDAMGASKVWGLISAELRLADGTGTPAPQSHAIVTSMGSVLGPRKNENFVLFSSGLAGAPGQPYYQAGATPQGGTDFGVSSVTPPGFPTNKNGCPPPFGSTAFDPVNLVLTLRVPTNVGRFAFDHAFFSAEYPEYACSGFNDMWVTLVDTAAPGIANNKNVVFDAQGTPGSVNLNFFDRCVAGPTGCAGTPGFNFCSGGKSELSGTGYGDFDAPCGVASSIGGGTGWVTTEVPVVPAEILKVQFMVWDSSDGVFDSAAIFDYFRWLKGSIATPLTFRP